MGRKWAQKYSLMVSTFFGRNDICSSLHVIVGKMPVVGAFFAFFQGKKTRNKQSRNGK